MNDRVRPLEWTGDFSKTAYAESQFGNFAAWIIGGTAYVRAPWFSSGGIPCGSTPDDAKKRSLELIWEFIRPALTRSDPAVRDRVTDEMVEAGAQALSKMYHGDNKDEPFGMMARKVLIAALTPPAKEPQ